MFETEGRSYSGGGKYLQNCNLVVIMAKRNRMEPHHTLLSSSSPHHNFVEVEEDFTDLEAKVEFLLDHPEEAVRIAQDGVAVYRDRGFDACSSSVLLEKIDQGVG